MSGKFNTCNYKVGDRVLIKDILKNTNSLFFLISNMTGNNLDGYGTIEFISSEISKEMYNKREECIIKYGEPPMLLISEPEEEVHECIIS